MQYVFTLISFLSTITLLAQDLTGEWKGKITQQPNREFYFEIRVEEQNNGKLRGTTFIREEKSGNFGAIKFRGAFNNQLFHLEETEITEEDKSNEDAYWGKNTFNWCIKEANLTFSEDGSTQTLSGPWESTGGCSPGRLSVSRTVEKEEPKKAMDCWGEPASADFLYGLWKGTFNQYSCGVKGPATMMILIDKVDGVKFSGVFIWTEMNYAQDSRSRLEGELKAGKIYFYEPELLSGGGLVLNGTYVSTLIDCNKMKGIWKLDAPTSECPDDHITEAGGDYELDHYEIPTIYFDFDQSTLRKKSIEDLNNLVDFMRKFPSLQLQLSGHTDNTGSNARNMNLSAERAEVVKDFLMQNGVSGKQIKTSHHAHTQPTADNKAEKGRQLNRRVEIKIISY